MLSVCLENFTEERVKKKTIAGRGKKLILAPRSCSQNIFGGGVKGKGQRKGSRDRSTYLRGTGDSRDKTSDKSKIKGGKKATRYS